MKLTKAERDWIQKPFPGDFPERLERFKELSGLSWKELGKRLGIKYGRLMGWRRGAVPKGLALLDLIRLARSVDGGLEVLFPGIAEALCQQERGGRGLGSQTSDHPTGRIRLP